MMQDVFTQFVRFYSPCFYVPGGVWKVLTLFPYKEIVPGDDFF